MGYSMERMKEDAAAIFSAGVAAVDPMRAVLSNLSLSGNVLTAGRSRIKLKPDGKIIVIGAGKAGAPMAAAVEQVLGERIECGLVIVKYGHAAALERVTIREAGHPVPDENGQAGAAQIAGLLEGAVDDDLVVFLISGGGSALLPLPAGPVTLSDKKKVTKLLLDSGADIHEINTVRKHLSRLKGGRLAGLAYPARVLTLVLSDVVGDDLDVIGSGPTVADPTTFSQALAVLDRYKLKGVVPPFVREILVGGAEGRIPETPKPGDSELDCAINVLVGTNAIALDAASDEAENLGYGSIVLSKVVTGEAREAAAAHSSIVHDVVAHGKPIRAPACLLSGGETTVTIRGNGKGGRNQEFVLAAALGIDGLPGVVILSGGTDGTDGPTNAAGAMADGTTISRARAAGMDPAAYLDDNDSYHFFQQLGDLFITGPTRTNVMDLMVMLVRKVESYR